MAPPLRSPFTPRARRTEPEVLDAADCDAALRERSLTDVARANRFLGGTRAVLAELRAAAPALARLQREVTLLDVGTGLGDIPAAARRVLSRHGIRVRMVGLDGAPSLARAAGRRVEHAVCGDALALPVAARSVDVVTCSQVLHHFSAADAARLIAEMDRVARVRAIVADLRRSWLAAGGLWAVSFPMGFHPVSRADGMLSVLKGFTAAELRDLVRGAIDRDPVVRHRLGWRVTATWTPA